MVHPSVSYGATFVFGEDNYISNSCEVIDECQEGEVKDAMKEQGVGANV